MVKLKLAILNFQWTIKRFFIIFLFSRNLKSKVEKQIKNTEWRIKGL